MANPEFVPLPVWTPYFESPPHIFKGTTSVSIICKAPAGVLSQLLAYPLKPAEADPTYFHIWAIKADEVIMETQTQRGSLIVDIGVPASFENHVGRHCFAEYINVGFGTSAGRELFGWPKKLAELSWSVYDDDVHIEVKRDGYTLVMLDITKPASQDQGAWPSIVGLRDSDSYLQVRPNGSCAPDGSPLLDVLTQSTDDAFDFKSSERAGAKVRLFDGPTDPLSFLGPIDVVAARVDTYDFEFGWGKVLGTLPLPNARQYARDCIELGKRLRTEAGFRPLKNPVRLKS